jgi:hypothetical protein
MAKIILEFDSFEEQDEMLSAINGGKWKSVVWDLSQYIRKRLKYENDLSEDAIKELEKMQVELCELLHELQLHLD